jgi:hypothetical protein
MKRFPLLILGAIVAGSIVAAGTQSISARPVVVLTRPASVAPQYVRPDGQCKSKGGVMASPCPVTVGASNPDQAVTITAPGSPAPTITETDNCAANNIALVGGAGTNYEVVAGTTAGKCKAKFTATNSKGKKVGKTTLNITNTGL